MEEEKEKRTLNSFRWFSARVSASIVTASKIASATSCESQGLTTILPFRLCAAPANSERIMTPCRCCWHAMYSYDTCHGGQHLCGALA